MDEVLRSEYPAMLANLHPGQAVQTVADRLKRINKINAEIADWLQERRRVEEQYITGLKKLLIFKVPNASSELGVFQPPWDRMLHATDSIAASHHLYVQRIEKDVEQPLRQFQGRKDVQNMQTMSANLASMGKELEDAQDKSDKLIKKGGKASALKVDAATARLESASSQWESQAPFILETLQALDEQRCNHLRDVLTQLQTHEVDQADRLRATANDALATILEVNTKSEVENFASRVTAGRPRLERRTPTAASMARQSTNVASSTTESSLAPPSMPAAQQEDNRSERSVSVPSQDKSESKIRSRIGTMLGRRRQSVHGGFGQLSPGPKNAGPFTRGLQSSHGRISVSPHNSSTNLAGSSNKLNSLAEAPDTPRLPPEHQDSQATTNGTNGDDSADAAHASSNNVLNGATAEEIFDAPPPPGPPHSHAKTDPAEPAKDKDGFTIVPVANDPISQAQREAEGEAEREQMFRLNIQNSPIAEEDPDESKAALSNVANTLSMQAPARRTGTIRGRRDVRNTIYVPSPIVPLPSDGSSLAAAEPTQMLPPSPALPGPSSSVSSSKPSAVQALASEASATGTSDTQSVRSATNSLGNFPHGKHPDITGPGLNSSIVETVSATFENNVLNSVKIHGEIAFAYNGESPSSTRETIRINDFPSLESIGPNRIFVSSTPVPDEFVVDLSHIPAKSATPGFTYRVHTDQPTADLASHCPLLLQTAWKPTGDKLGLLLQYRLNPATHLPKPVTLKNFFIVTTYEGARASNVQTKPTGTHLKDKHLVYWRLGDVTFQEGSDWNKIVCRIIGAESGEPQPGHVEARWEYISTPGEVAGSSGGISISRKVEGKGKGKAVEEEDEEDDPFADDSAVVSPKIKDDGSLWADVPLVRKIVSGRYEAN